MRGAPHGAWLVACVLAFAPALRAANAADVGPTNPPPSSPLRGYAGYELQPVTVADEDADRRNIDRVLDAVDENLEHDLAPILSEWNAAADGAGNPEKLVIQPHIVRVYKPSSINRYLTGPFSGRGYVVLEVKISEQSTGKVVAEPRFYRHSSAAAGAFTLGAQDSAMLWKVTHMVADYLQANYPEAVGGVTGYEPKKPD